MTRRLEGVELAALEHPEHGAGMHPHSIRGFVDGEDLGRVATLIHGVSERP